MLRQTKDLLDLAIVASEAATDGAIGNVKDLYFDDEGWAIPYLVVDTGSWLSSGKLLISPIAAGKPDWASKLLPVSLTRAQVKNSPDIDTDMPVTRQHETEHLDHDSYPHDPGGMGLCGGGGYQIETSDGEIGAVQGLLAEEERWAIRYLVVRASNGWLGELEVAVCKHNGRAACWPDAQTDSDRAALPLVC